MTRASGAVAAVAACALVFLTTAAAGAAPQPRLAVLELEASRGVDPQTAADLTDVVRTVAGDRLGERFDILTRDNLLVLLKANRKTLAECEGECEVETGRLIGADLVVSGRLGQVGRAYLINLRAHDTRDARLLKGATEQADTEEGLIAGVQRAAGHLFAALGGAAPAVATGRERAGGTAAPAGVAPAMVPAPARLVVEGTPAGAAVALTGPRDFGGPAVAALPATWAGMPAGDYTVRITAPRHAAFERRVALRAGRTERLRVALDPAFGTLVVEGEPPGALVHVAGPAGFTADFELPGQVAAVPPGDCVVEVTHAGHEPQRERIAVLAGDRAVWRVRLVPLLPGVRVRLNPAEIKQVVATVSGRVRACYEAHGPQQAGEVFVRARLTINPDGAVAAAVVTNAPFTNAMTAGCVVPLLWTLRFPARAGAPQTVNVPFKVQ